jgi:hypothetical protein
VAADQSIALDVKTPAPPEVPTFNPASPLASAQDLLGNQTKLQMLNRENAGQDIQFRNSLISNAAAHALDADSWDAAMRAAVQKGAPEAAQYVGRYTPLLQQRLFDAYTGSGGAQGQGAAPAAATGGTPAGGTATSPDMLDRMYANVSPQQMAQSLQKNNMILQALSTVKDQQSYDRAISWLGSNGIPNAAQIAGPYNPLQVLRLWNDTQQRVGYLQNRVAAASTGAPNPLIKNDVSTVGDVAYSVDPYKGTAIPLTPSKKEFVGVDKTGTMSSGVFDPQSGTYTDINGQPGASPFTAFAAKMNQGESGGAPNAKNPLSSATGPGQFIDSTWLSTVKAARPDLVKGMTDNQILAMRSDPQLNQEMTVAYAQSNAAKLSTAGLPVTTATLALAHRFGPDGAETILNAPPSAKLSDILPKKVMDANPTLAGMTAGQYAQTITNQFGNTPMESQAPAAGEQTHGDDYLKTLPATMSAQVKAYAEGRQPLPTGFALKSPYFQNMLRMVTQYDPSFDAVNYNARAATRRDFTSGKSAVTINSMNTALGHLDQLDNAATALNNGDIPALNAVENWFATATGKPAPKNFNAIAGLVAEELTRVYRGVGGAEADIKRHMADVDVNSSPEQIRGALYEISELLKSKLDAMGEQYNQGMGTTEDPLRLLNGPAQSSFNRLLSYGAEGTGKPKAGGGTPEGGTVVRPSQAFVNGRIYRDAVSGDMAQYQDGKWIPVPAGTPPAAAGAR